MPLTTRTAIRAMVSGLLAVALATAGAGVAGAAPVDPRDDTATARTAIPARAAALTPGSGPVAVTVLVPLTVPPTEAGLLSADEIARYTGGFGTLTRQLDAVAGRGATIAVDPMILASIRALGSAAPESATAWLARLDAVGNEVFALAYADADVAAAVRSGTTDALTPRGFTFALDPAAFAEPTEPSPTTGPTPAPTEDAGGDGDALPPYPSTDDLVEWTTELPAIAWPGAGLGAGDLAGIAAAGYTEVVVDSASGADDDHALVQYDGIRGVVADTTLTTLFRDASGVAAPTGTSAEIDTLLAGLGAETSRAPGRGVVVTLDRGGARAAVGLASVLDAIATSDAARLIPLSELLAGDAVEGPLGSGADTSTRDATLVRVAEATAAETAFSSVLSDPAPLLDPRSLARLALYAVSWEDQPTAWTEATSAFLDRSDEIVTSVRIEQGSDTLLLAHSADFRVTVSNALDLPVTVRVSIDPRSAILRADGPVEITVEAQANGTATIPVEAVANGEILVETTITSPTGVPLDAGFAKVSVQAEWEGVGTLVVVLLLVGVFAAGILRIVVQRRRARVKDSDPSPAAEDADE